MAGNSVSRRGQGFAAAAIHSDAVSSTSLALSPTMIAAVSHASTPTSRGVANVPIRALSLVNWISGITAKGSWRERMTCERMRSL
jgi:hypothetical protein